MREAIGGTWITQLVIVMMFVFVAFLALSINYSKAFRVKNEVTSMIEKKEGLSTSTIELINNYLRNNGYNYKGKCEKTYYGVNLENNTKEVAQDGKKYSYCVSKVKSTSVNFGNRVFYKIKVFFKFNLPVMGEIYTFSVDGQSKDVAYPNDDMEIEAKLKYR